MYGITSSRSLALRIRFGIAACEVRKKTPSDWAVVEGMAAIAANAGALTLAVGEPWHCRQEASASLRPAVASPPCCPKEGSAPARRISANSAHRRDLKAALPLAKSRLFMRKRRRLGSLRDSFLVARTARKRWRASARERRTESASRPRGMRSRTGRAMSALVHPHESVCTPVLAADAVMEKEQTLGIVFLLGRAQPRVIAAPERVLPVRREV